MTGPEHCARVITYRGADREPIPCGRLRPCPYHDDHNRPDGSPSDPIHSDPEKWR